MSIEGKDVSSLYFEGNQIWSKVTEPDVPLTGLAAHTWTDISILSQAGDISMFTVGETKKLTLSDGREVTFCYVGTETDSSGKLAMTFMQIDNFVTTKWHSSSSSWKTYSASSISSEVISKVYNTEVEGFLRSVTKRYKSKNNSTTTTTATFNAWIPSITEICGTTMSPNISNGVTYAYTQTDELSSLYMFFKIYMERG